MRIGDPVQLRITYEVGEVHEVLPKEKGHSGRLYLVGKPKKVRIESDIEIDEKTFLSKKKLCSTYDLYPIHCYGERFRQCRRKVSILRGTFRPEIYVDGGKYNFTGFCNKHYAWYEAKAKGFINKAEAELAAILRELFKDRFEFVGNYPTVGKWKPDFIDNKNKLIIELFGDYWHSEKKQNLPEEQHIQERVDLFESYGYRTLIIWEKELVNWNNVKKRIKEFVE
jgi:very-short-patch-repair endonuclease